MDTTLELPAVMSGGKQGVTAARSGVYARAEGLELLGRPHGTGYPEGTSLVRRADGRMVQLSPLLYGLLDCLARPQTAAEAAVALSATIGRRVGPEQVVRLAEKLGQQALLAGTEDAAPPAPNPLMALRWKVLVTRPGLTRLLTTPFTVLFRPWIMWPALAGFGAVFWFVLIHKGVAAATAQAFNDPGLLLLVFALGVVSAGFHELGHAAACRYAGAEPRGFGVGLYLVWPCFYTDVTDAYRLPRRDRLRVDLAGLYFNALVAVATMILWLVWRKDALLLLVALQLLQMVKQLSPVIRADGYHILSDATGVPDLYAHMGPTLRSLLPGGRRRTVLHGWTRVFVTIWVLVMVPVLASLMLGAVLLLPRLVTTAWTSGRRIVDLIPQQAAAGQTLHVCADLVELLAILLPVVGTVLMTQKFVRTYAAKARAWSRGRPGRTLAVALVAAALAAGLAYAWWPSGQYQPVRADQRGTLPSLITTLGHPQEAVRPDGGDPVSLAPGTYLTVAMIPVGGASTRHPALFIVPPKSGRPAVALLSTSGFGGSAAALPAPAGSGPAAPSPTDPGTPTASGAGTAGAASPATPVQAGGTSQPGTPGSGGSDTAATYPSVGGPAASGTSAGQGPTSTRVLAAAFPFRLPAPPGPGDSQAVAIGARSNGVVYDVAYSLVTVTRGHPVLNRNSAYALASCNACTTVAVSVQVVLVVGQSRIVAPVNTAEALNSRCPACATTAIADQIVVTLRSRPTPTLTRELTTSLEQLDSLESLGAAGTPQAVAAEVSAVQQTIQTELAGSGQVAAAGTTSTAGSSTSTSTTGSTSASTSGTAAPGATTSSSSSSSTNPSATTSTSDSATTSAQTGGGSTTSTSTATSTAPTSSGASGSGTTSSSSTSSTSKASTSASTSSASTSGVSSSTSTSSSSSSATST